MEKYNPKRKLEGLYRKIRGREDASDFLHGNILSNNKTYPNDYEQLKNLYKKHLYEKGKVIREEILKDLERIRGSRDYLVKEYRELISKFSEIYNKYVNKRYNLLSKVYIRILEIEDEVLSEYLENKTCPNS